MNKTQFSKKSGRQKLSPKRLLAALIALVVAFLLLSSVINLASKYFGIKTRIRELETEQQSLRQKHETLKKTNEYYATPEGTEQALREKYNLVKPGEEMIVITQPALDKRVEKKATGFRRFWDAIVRGLGIKK